MLEYGSVLLAFGRFGSINATKKLTCLNLGKDSLRPHWYMNGAKRKKVWDLYITVTYSGHSKV